MRLRIWHMLTVNEVNAVCWVTFERLNVEFKGAMPGAEFN